MVIQKLKIFIYPEGIDLTLDKLIYFNFHIK
jgi:hypothetical protein